MLESRNHYRDTLTAHGLQFEDAAHKSFSTFTRVGRSPRFIPEFAFNDEMLRRVISLRGWRFAHGCKPIPAGMNYKPLDAECALRAAKSNRMDWKLVATACGTYMSLQAAIAWEAWRLGYHSYEIAAELNLSTSTVEKTVRRLNRAARDLGFPTYKLIPLTYRTGPERRPIDANRICELRRNNWSVPRIAAEIGDSNFRVRRALKENGFDASYTTANRKNISGQRFGRLVVLEMSGLDASRAVLWLCRCDCGKEKVIQGHSLRSGHTKSCGCLPRGGNRRKNPSHVASSL